MEDLVLHRIGKPVIKRVKMYRCYVCKKYYLEDELVICTGCGKVMCPEHPMGNKGDDDYCVTCHDKLPTKHGEQH